MCEINQSNMMKHEYLLLEMKCVSREPLCSNVLSDTIFGTVYFLIRKYVQKFRTNRGTLLINQYVGRRCNHTSFPFHKNDSYSFSYKDYLTRTMFGLNNNSQISEMLWALWRGCTFTIIWLSGYGKWLLFVKCLWLVFVIIQECRIADISIFLRCDSN